MLICYNEIHTFTECKRHVVFVGTDSIMRLRIKLELGLELGLH